MDNINYEELLKNLGMGDEEAGSGASSGKIELKDPATGEARTYQTSAEAQAAIDSMYKTLTASQERLVEKLGQTPQPTVVETPKPKENNPYNMTEAELKEFNKLSELDPQKALEMLVVKTPKWQQLEQTVNALASQQMNAQAAVTAQSFLNNHRAELLDNPNASVVQNEVSQLVRALVPQGATPTALHMEVALNNLKLMKPNLFPQAETVGGQTMWQNPYPTTWGGTPQPPPTPQRTGGSSVGGLGFEQVLEKLYDQKGPDAVKRYLESAMTQGSRY